MSTKRQPQVNDESYEALQALFVKIAESDATLIASDDVWRQVLDARWFQTEVRIQAARLVGGDLDDPLFQDMVQQVPIQIRVKLSKRGDLGGDAAQLRTNFPGWMSSIIRNACIDTLRRERRHAHSSLAESQAAKNQVPLEDLRLDMADVIDRLEAREREVAYCKLRELTMPETAGTLDLSARQVERLLKKVLRLLKRALAVYWNDR
jgi:RNA polymerase sigma factor (sigma-70 family)